MAYHLKSFLLALSFNLFNPAYSRVFNVSGSQEFVGALDEIQAGDKVFLQPGTYYGEFVLPELGRAKSHTLITSSSQDASSVIISGRGRDPPLTVNGTRWALTDFTIANKLEKTIGTGLVLKMDEAFVKNLIIRDVDVAVQSEGNKVMVKECEIHATKFGLYMFGNQSFVMGNKIYGANPCIFVDDLSCCGVVKNNHCDIKGSHFINGQNYRMDDKTKAENDLNRFDQ